MNRKRKVFLVIIFCMGVLCGCGSRNNVYLEKIQTETSEVPQTEEKDCQEEMGSCTCLLSTDRSPVFSQAFVNFSQFNLDFHEFRNCFI